VTGPAAAPYDATDSLVGLARTLRAAGVDASPERVQAAVIALSVLDPGRRDDVYWAGRLTLCGTQDELARYDAVFRAYFGDRPGSIVRRQRVSRPVLQMRADGDEPPPSGDGEGGDEQLGAAAAASSVEQLRHRDVARLTPAERAELNVLLAALRLRGEQRLTRRRRPGPTGPVDAGRTLRAWLRAGGEPARLLHHRPTPRPRRVVLLVDVSGSMDAYADALLRFAHAAAHRGSGRTEVFVLGTRLARVTREMAHRDPDVAWVLSTRPAPTPGAAPGSASCSRSSSTGGASAAPRAAQSSSSCPTGGSATTRSCSASRCSACSGWPTGGLVQPAQGRPGLRPRRGGMAAALPHVDDFVEGHSLAAYEHLAQVVLGRRREGGSVRDVARELLAWMRPEPALRAWRPSSASERPSSPRPPARRGRRSRGRGRSGCVSGGCVEGALLRAGRAVLADDAAGGRDYCISDETASRSADVRRRPRRARAADRGARRRPACCAECSTGAGPTRRSRPRHRRPGDRARSSAARRHAAARLRARSVARVASTPP
jgi:uncharacterized protein with von Willebrand factor type A (vWA) domain